MRGKDLLDKIELADDKYVDEAAGFKKEKRFDIIKITAAAAVLALVIAAIPITTLIMKPNDDSPVGTEINDHTDTAEVTREITRYTGAVFTASEIGKMFNTDQMEDGTPTNAYTKIYTVSEEYLTGMPVPDGGSVGIYDIKAPDMKATEEGAKEFGEAYLSKICKAAGIKIPDEKIKERTDHEDGSLYYEMFKSIDNDRFIGYSEVKYIDSFFFGTFRTGISLDGVPVSVDQRETNEEMIRSIEPLREKLCELFGIDLPDVYIERRYDSYNEYGCAGLTVYFYNKGNNKVDFNICKCSDYISINFSNSKNYDTATVSRSVLKRADLKYYHYRCAPEKICALIGTADVISLEKAEALLDKGYVFGGHVCPLCMAAQEKIAFDKYDKVAFVYCNGIPFYAFFKKLDEKTENGNLTYARTLVPAVEVSGYEEYYESQISYHNGYSPDILYE